MTAALEAKTEDSIRSTLVYDLWFLAGEERVQPQSGELSVTMNFLQPVLTEKAPQPESLRKEVTGTAISVYRMTDASAELMAAETTLNEDGALTAVAYTTESLSALAMVKTEAKSDRTYVYEDNTVKITIVVPAEVILPEEAELVVRPLTDGSEEYKAAVGQIEKVTEKAIEKAVAYDICFLVDGTEVEPENGDAEISFAFKEKPVTETEGNETAGEMTIYHVESDNTVEKIQAEADIDGTGAISSLNFSMDSFSPTVVPLDERELTTTDTYLGNGGNYSLGYIFANFNVFVSGNYTGTHVVGPVAAGGNTSLNYFGGAISGDIIPHQVSSYFLGTMDLYDSTLEEGNSAKMGYVTSSDVPIYFGMVNKEKHSIFQSDKRGSSSLDYYTDDYLNFGEAFASIQAQTANYSASIRIDREAIASLLVNTGKNQEIDMGGYSVTFTWNGVTINLPMGYSYEIDSLDSVNGSWDGKIKINYTGEEEASTNGTDTIVKVLQSGKVTMPSITIDGGDVSGWVSTEVGEGFGLAYLMPNATEVTAVNHLGHISAPNAVVEPSGGNWSGCIIAREVMARPGEWGSGSGSEGHMWPYNGKSLTPDSTEFPINKQVNGKTPGVDQKFRFVMENIVWPENTGKMADRKVYNNYQQISFGSITYSVEGTYVYKIYEDPDYKSPDDTREYEMDKAVYYAVVTVSQETDHTTGGTQKGKLKAETKYYKSYDLITNTPGEPVLTADGKNEIFFNNKTTLEGQIKVTKSVTYNGEADTEAAGKTFTVSVYEGEYAAGKTAVETAEITIGADGSGTNQVTLDLTAEAVTGAVNLNNLYYELPDGYFRDAQISISKKVLKDGEEYTSEEETFYAGIFTADNTLVQVAELKQNDTITVQVPLGGENGTEPVTYYVYETDSTGTPVDPATFAYDISGEGTVTLDVENTAGRIEITNEWIEEEEPEATPTPTPARTPEATPTTAPTAAPEATAPPRGLVHIGIAGEDRRRYTHPHVPGAFRRIRSSGAPGSIHHPAEKER